MAGWTVWIPAAVASGSFVRYTLLPQAIGILGTVLWAVKSANVLKWVVFKALHEIFVLEAMLS